MKDDTVLVHTVMYNDPCGFALKRVVRRNSVIEDVVRSCFTEPKIEKMVAVNGMYCEITSTFEEVGIEPGEDVYLAVKKWVPPLA